MAENLHDKIARIEKERGREAADKHLAALVEGGNIKAKTLQKERAKGRSNDRFIQDVASGRRVADKKTERRVTRDAEDPKRKRAELTKAAKKAEATKKAEAAKKLAAARKAAADKVIAANKETAKKVAAHRKARQAKSAPTADVAVPAPKSPSPPASAEAEAAVGSAPLTAAAGVVKSKDDLKREYKDLVLQAFTDDAIQAEVFKLVSKHLSAPGSIISGELVTELDKMQNLAQAIKYKGYKRMLAWMNANVANPKMLDAVKEVEKENHEAATRIQKSYRKRLADRAASPPPPPKIRKASKAAVPPPPPAPKSDSPSKRPPPPLPGAGNGRRPPPRVAPEARSYEETLRKSEEYRSKLVAEMGEGFESSPGQYTPPGAESKAPAAASAEVSAVPPTSKSKDERRSPPPPPPKIRRASEAGAPPPPPISTFPTAAIRPESETKSTKGTVMSGAKGREEDLEAVKAAASKSAMADVAAPPPAASTTALEEVSGAPRRRKRATASLAVDSPPTKPRSAQSAELEEYKKLKEHADIADKKAREAKGEDWRKLNKEASEAEAALFAFEDSHGGPEELEKKAEAQAAIRMQAAVRGMQGKKKFREKKEVEEAATKIAEAMRDRHREAKSSKETVEKLLQQPGVKKALEAAIANPKSKKTKDLESLIDKASRLTKKDARELLSVPAEKYSFVKKKYTGKEESKETVAEVLANVVAVSDNYPTKKKEALTKTFKSSKAASIMTRAASRGNEMFAENQSKKIAATVDSILQENVLGYTTGRSGAVKTVSKPLRRSVEKAVHDALIRARSEGVTPEQALEGAKLAVSKFLVHGGESPESKPDFSRSRGSNGMAYSTHASRETYGGEQELKSALDKELAEAIDNPKDYTSKNRESFTIEGPTGKTIVKPKVAKDAGAYIDWTLSKTAHDAGVQLRGAASIASDIAHEAYEADKKALREARRQAAEGLSAAGSAAYSAMDSTVGAALRAGADKIEKTGQWLGARSVASAASASVDKTFKDLIQNSVGRAGVVKPTASLKNAVFEATMAAIGDKKEISKEQQTAINNAVANVLVGDFEYRSEGEIKKTTPDFTRTNLSKTARETGSLSYDKTAYASRSAYGEPAKLSEALQVAIDYAIKHPAAVEKPKAKPIKTAYMTKEEKQEHRASEAEKKVAEMETRMEEMAKRLAGPAAAAGMTAEVSDRLAPPPGKKPEPDKSKDGGRGGPGRG